MQSIQQLLEIMRALRDPDSGCPWDLEQNFQSLIPYTLEEAHEVADAIERKDLNDIKDELGDLLFQIVFYSQLANEQQAFDFNDVVQSISDKLTRRHPHVFAGAHVENVAEQTKEWKKIKQQEREQKGINDSNLSVLDDVSRHFPSIMRAVELQKRAAKEGFDWNDIEDVVAKVHEEITEVEVELEQGNEARLEDELGDLFFACINLSRHAGMKYTSINTEQCIRKANLKFERRFKEVEKLVIAKNLIMKEMSVDALEKLWQDVKQTEKAGS
ncbi:MAG: nucleoside triphosphate pyrophosphohydrolase [Woeseiaceae bacterium]